MFQVPNSVFRHLKPDFLSLRLSHCVPARRFNQSRFLGYSKLPSDWAVKFGIEAIVQRKTTLAAAISTGPATIDMGAEAKPPAKSEAAAEISSDTRNIARELLDFINEAWTPFHAVGKDILV